MNIVRKGFTLIELLVVIGVLAILLTITLIAINPQRQFQQANNAKRTSDVNQILNAVYEYAADTRGALPAGIGTTVTAISSTGTGAAFCTALVPTYLAALPTDPKTGDAIPVTEAGCAGAYNTGYTIIQTTANRVTVSAPDAELQIVISVTK